MLDGPLYREVQGTPWQVTDDDFQCPDVDLCFVSPYNAWKCGGACSRQNIWITIPKNWLMVGMNVSWIQDEPIMPPVFVTLRVLI